jgi:disulfide bond formation protein DsbB
MSIQRLFGLIFFLVLAALGAGYYIQHGLGIEPCPLCIVQRLAFVAVGQQ